MPKVILKKLQEQMKMSAKVARALVNVSAGIFLRLGNCLAILDVRPPRLTFIYILKWSLNRRKFLLLKHFGVLLFGDKSAKTSISCTKIGLSN